MVTITNSFGHNIQANAICPVDTTAMENLLFDEQGQLRPVPADDLKAIPHNDLQFFCLKHGIYSVPSIELIEFLETQIIDKTKAIEIGSGNGVYGRALDITATDNYQMHPKNRAKFRNCIKAYEDSGQPLTTYGNNVIEIDGVEAVRKYKAETVLGCWVTHKYNPTQAWRGGNMFGVNMPWILQRNSVKRFILVGNETVHNNSPLMELPHETYDLPGILFSRAQAQNGDRVYVWDC